MDALSIYVLAMSILLFVLMGVDKFNAKMGNRRVPEKVLFGIAILGGGIGGTMGMYSFRHKTRHWYFAVFFPVLAVLDLVAVVMPG